MSDRKVFVIAEAGVNHNGDPRIAERLVDEASRVGADAVKFQTFSADRIVTESAPKAQYQVAEGSAGETQHSMLKRLELPIDVLKELKRRAESNGIELLSSPFDVESTMELKRLSIRRWKIPSGEITNRPYLELIGAFKQPIILSTGMSYLGEVEQALEVLTQSGAALDLITLLHCNSAYPTEPEDVNLNAMLTLKSAFETAVGFSDHTLGTAIPLAAVALGATVIEKHLTLDCTLPGPDHKASMEPEPFRTMVEGIRDITLGLGSGRKIPSESELANRTVVRKSIVAARVIHKGEVFTADSVTAKRPAGGVSPMQIQEILGHPASRHFPKDEQIRP